jgi:hypothetical protein
MSDVANAPAPAPAAPAPAAAPPGEVVVNQNPVNAPQPVGSQAPDRPTGEVEGSPHRPPTRRETIQRAFDRAAAQEQEPRKPAAARPKIDKVTKVPEGEELNLRKPPAQQHREHGRFAKAPEEGSQSGQVGSQSGQQGQQGQQAAARANPLPETAPYREPPPRFSELSKNEWHAAPESVRGDVYRMAQEFSGAYQKYRADHETMNSIRHFHEMATQHGTTLDQALNNYVGMEQKLRQNPLAGFDQITNNLNLRTSDGRKITFRDICWHVVNSTPEQLAQIQNQNMSSAQSNQIGQLHKAVESLENNLRQMHYERQFGLTRSAVDEFADSPGHERFDELGDLIEQELRLGFTLEQAYARAARLRPPTGIARAAQTRNTPAQTRSDKSISGAPEAGPSNGQQSRHRSDKPVGRREAIENAIRRVNGA